MKNILIVFCFFIMTFNNALAGTLSKNDMFLFKETNKISILKTISSKTFFEKSPDNKQCKLKNIIVSKDKIKNSNIISLITINIDSNKSNMGIPEFSLDSKIKFVKEGENHRDKEWENTVFYIGQRDQENFLLFAPFWRLENSNNKLNLGLQKIDVVGDIKEFINSLRELIAYSLEVSILEPEKTRPKSYSKGTIFPYLLINDTNSKSYSTRLAFSPNIFAQFAECAEPILFETMKNPFLNFTSTLASKSNLYLTCSGKEPVMDIDLPVINLRINFHNGISTVTQGTDHIEYAVNSHDPLKSIMQFGKKKELTSIWSYRWNNTPENLLKAQDNMFRGFDVYSRFMVSNFYKNKDNIWIHMQLYRSLDYKPEVWKRKCIEKDKKWWKRITYGIKGLKE